MESILDAEMPEQVIWPAQVVCWATSSEMVYEMATSRPVSI